MRPQDPDRYRIAPVGFDDFAWANKVLQVSSRAVRFVLSELMSPVRLPFRRAVRGWRLGFGKLPNLVYQLDRHDPALYIPHLVQMVRATRINGLYDHVLNNKLLLPVLMNHAGVPFARTLAYGIQGRIFTGAGGRIEHLDQWLAAELGLRASIAVKPIKGRKGQGFAVMAREGGNTVINGRSGSVEDMAALLKRMGSFLVTVFVEQADYARQLYPATTNTLRLLTMWDHAAGRPFLAAAAQRVGNRRSYPTDNWRGGRGGYCAEVDMETELLSRAATVSADWQLEWVSAHPESGAAIEGVAVPRWAEVKQSLLDAAARLAFAPLIAWDVAITKDAFCVLEVNGTPGLHVHQVHRPLLADPRVREFYKTYGVIR